MEHYIQHISDDCYLNTKDLYHVILQKECTHLIIFHRHILGTL